jgi:arginyl-tRNA synthetase
MSIYKNALLAYLKRLINTYNDFYKKNTILLYENNLYNLFTLKPGEFK